jgi:hypothetical protein
MCTVFDGVSEPLDGDGVGGGALQETPPHMTDDMVVYTYSIEGLTPL